jgi:predicted nucleic acid-binding protein
VTPVLLDTNVLSELVRVRPDPRVTAFVADVAEPLISALTVHELVYGAARLLDLERRERLMAWVASVRERFEGRLVDVDADVADVAGRLRAAASANGRPVDPVDALIAASALVRGATVATRNVRDFEPLGVEVVDPWVGA